MWQAIQVIPKLTVSRLSLTILQTQRDVILTLTPAQTQEEGGRPSPFNWQALKRKYSKSLQTMVGAAESKESLWPCKKSSNRISERFSD